MPLPDNVIAGFLTILMQGELQFYQFLKLQFPSDTWIARPFRFNSNFQRNWNIIFWIFRLHKIQIFLAPTDSALLD